VAESSEDVLLLAGRFEVRGTSSYTLRLARGLTGFGFHPCVITPDARAMEDSVRRDLQIQTCRRLDSRLFSPIILRWLASRLAANPPEVIHVQTRRLWRHGSWLARRLQRPMVLTVHDHLSAHEALRVDRRWCQRIIAVSDAVAAELLSRTRLPRELVEVIPSGVEIRADDACPPVLEPGHIPVVGTAGPLEAVKGFPYFLGAAHRVLAAGREAEFLIAGAGPEEGTLRRLARELGISRKVTFVPYLLDFSPSLAATDIFCLPSLQQGLGTIMLEAMSYARPVIATAVGGISSIITHGETGLVVPPASSVDLAERIIELLDNPVKARGLGEAARRHVADHYSARQMIAKTADLYRRVIGDWSGADSRTDGERIAVDVSGERSA
jgi:glycosyltransferase involved in cell wall biosynthesis